MHSESQSLRDFVPDEGRPYDASSVLIVACVALAAVVQPIRPFLALALMAGYLATRRRSQAWMPIAAVLPVALIMAWDALPQPLADPHGAQCTDLLGPPAVWRLIEGLVALVAVTALVVDQRILWRDLGLRRGSRRTVAVAIAGFLVIGPIALLASTFVGGIFFGKFALDLTRPAAVVPAMVFAVSNALAEELSYRGSMRVWLTPMLGTIGANLAQAIVFGLAHTGGDFVGPMAPVVVSMIAVGFAGGIIARRTGSLTILLAIHAAADVPIYFYWARRVG